MITAQDVREKTFERAKFSGYDMNDVDNFLDELAEDLTAMQKENTVLKSKMKVLVDKIEEYRANEEALNLAVVSAQKLAVQIESDARARANAMLAEADKKVSEKIGSITERTEIEERRLAEAKAASAKFFDAIRTICSGQIKKIDNIALSMGFPEKEAPAAAPVVAPAAPAPVREAAVEETVRTIENNVSRITPEPMFNIDLSGAIDAARPSRKADSTQQFNF